MIASLLVVAMIAGIQETYPTSDVYHALMRGDYEGAQKIYEKHGTLRFPLSKYERTHLDIISKLATVSRDAWRVPGVIRQIDWCIERGADVRSSGGAPLYVAAKNDASGDLIKHLLKKGARVSDGNPLFGAVQGNRILNAQILLNKGVKVNPFEPSTGDTPLIIAVRHNRIDMVKFLIKRGAKVNLPNQKTKRTPLMEAAKNDRVTIIKFLLSEGANKSLKDKNGQTAIQIAKESGRHVSVEMLKG